MVCQDECMIKKEGEGIFLTDKEIIWIINKLSHFYYVPAIRIIIRFLSNKLHD